MDNDEDAEGASVGDAARDSQPAQVDAGSRADIDYYAVRRCRLIPLNDGRRSGSSNDGHRLVNSHPIISAGIEHENLAALQCLLESVGQRATSISRRIAGVKDLIGKAWCPWHLTINILLDDELPNNDEEKLLSQLEDELHSLVRSVCEDFDYVGRVTVNGLRRLHFYLDAHEDAHEALRATVENGTPKELDYLLAYDPTWAEVNHLFDDA